MYDFMNFKTLGYNLIGFSYTVDGKINSIPNFLDFGDKEQKASQLEGEMSEIS